MDSAGSDRPQRRTALLGRELDRYKVEIAAMRETRLAVEGLLKEVGACYTFFWSGRKKEERREAGGFAIKSHLCQQAYIETRVEVAAVFIYMHTTIKGNNLLLWLLSENINKKKNVTI